MQNLVEIDTLTAKPVIERREGERTSAFQREINAYLERYPKTQQVDILLNDLNGCFRGKRIPLASLYKLDNGCYFPSSVFAMDIHGQTVEEADPAQARGEPDYLCLPVSGTLSPSAVDPEHIAQLLLTMRSEDGEPFELEPRNVLDRVWQKLLDRGIHPVVALELEFYLVDRHRTAEGRLQPPCAPGTFERHTQCQVYSLDNLDNFAGVLNDIDRLARLQKLPIDGAVAESSPGQFEINLRHGDNPLKVCDQALQFKRLVRQAAECHGMTATFMAKPYEKYAGSGMHMHISLTDGQGNNLLVDGNGGHSPTMRSALAGMLALMPASMALLAPNVNAYRRLQPDMYVPLHATWGENNRRVALRIPCSDRDNHRVEYRVAGADANPYLAVAAALTGILHGLETQPPLPAAAEGSAAELADAPSLPSRQCEALRAFTGHPVLERYLGQRFCHVYHSCKQAELRQFERRITETEIDWMLKSV